MKSINFDLLDLNLLRLLVALAETGSVSKAATRLGLSQPAASNALSRLRVALGDPLFQRTRGGMAPTRFVKTVLPTIRENLAGIHACLGDAAGFDPATSQRCFRLSLSGLGEAAFLPRLVDALFREAPEISLQNRSVPLPDLAGALSQGDVDLAIGLIHLDRPGIRARPLFADTYVAVAGTGRAQYPCAIEDLQAERIAIAAPAATYDKEINEVLAKSGLSSRVALHLREFGALPALLSGGHVVAVVPKQYADQLAAADRAVLLPIALSPTQSRVNMVWSANAESDPGLRWLMGVVEQQLSEHA